MMARAWLILADTLVLLLLLSAFILYFLYPPSYNPPKMTTVSKVTTMQQSDPKTCRGDIPIPVEANVTLSKIKEMNLTTDATESPFSLEEILQMSQEVAMQEYLEEAQYRYTPLQTRLNATETQRGDAVFIRIFKKEALLEVWIKKDERYVHLKDYAICAYSGHLGPKLREGDKQAPEGFYRVYPRQLNPHSKFHLAFNLGYPNAYDRAHHRTGSFLMVHGNCVSVGCYAMTDAKIEEIYGLVAAALRNGQPYVPVHIFPFRMEDTTMDAYSESRWYDFWMELKEGYDYFEAEEVPPKVEVVDGHYVISEPE